ncbi:mitogen-activated protein kinase kinase kinase [Malassezia obtusa]|uniref:Mitogen-activated protein kinase kinase kinase n=1 Tax=Malassezia obtusa TaxID=76774 RepID=A0AAF0IS09_9BASI|nr:mitogen-activated protein kinase kinase kinase [Malassezia obtusa]
MSRLPRGTEYAAGGDYANTPYPVLYPMPSSHGAMRTSPPPLNYAVENSGRGARPHGDEPPAPLVRHIRNSSSPAGMYEPYNDPGAWQSPSPPSAGSHWSAISVGSPRARSHILPPRATPVRLATDSGRVPSPTASSVRPLGASRPFSSSSIHSQSSTSSNDHAERVLIQATLDNEHFSVVNVSGLDSAPAIKACILRKLQIATQDLSHWALVRTEIGHSDLSNSPLIDDDTLLALCLQLGDDKGTIKFLVQHHPPSARAYDSPRLRGATAPPAVAQRSPAPWPLQKSATSLPWSGPYNAPGVHEAMAQAPWSAPRRAPPNAASAPPWSTGVPTATTRNDPYVTSVYPASSNRQVTQFQQMATHSPALQPGMTVQTVLGVSGGTPRPGHEHRASAIDAPASLQPANPAFRQLASPSLGTSSPASSHMSLTRSPRADAAFDAEAQPPGYEQAVQATSSGSPWPAKTRSFSHSSSDSRPSLKGRSASSPIEPRSVPPAMQPTVSSGGPASDEHHSVYPLFKSEEHLDRASPDARDGERSARPLPVIPSPVSASPSSIRLPDAQAPSQRFSWGRDQGSSATTATSVSTPQSEPGEEERLASMQRLMQHVRVAEERKPDAAEPTFDSFSDDTLGGTFAQSLDAATLRDSDTLRAERTSSTGHEETASTSRPVLTLSISPNAKQAAEPAPSAVRHEPRRPIERTSSFANRNNHWAFRPPTEQLYEQLDDLFPRHDLDKPLSETAGATPSTDGASTAPSGSAAPRNDADLVVQFPPKPARGLARNQHHSIRVIAQNRKRFLEKTKHVERRRGTRDEPVLDRRRSTKLWGGRMVEMRTNGPESVGLVPDSTTGPEVEPSTRPVFKWVKGDLIGKGTYGRVYLALNATTGEMIAVKQVELPRTSSDRDSSRQRGVVAALRSEIETLKDLDHPNVVTCLGFEQTLDTLSIFLEYVPGGSIGSCLRKHGKFDEDTVSSFLNQTLQGLAYLHKQGILHRDLKADNLLVDFQGTCKISDFGTVRRSDDIYSNVENMSLQGSIFWMAPEVVGLSRKGYSAKVDIWSLGCVVLEMLAGRRPWSDEEAIQAMFKIGAERRAPPVPADCKPSKPAAHFLRNCFEIDPDRRPTAARLLEHVFAWPSPDYSFENSALYKALHKDSVD